MAANDRRRTIHLVLGMALAVMPLPVAAQSAASEAVASAKKGVRQMQADLDSAQGSLASAERNVVEARKVAAEAARLAELSAIQGRKAREQLPRVCGSQEGSVRIIRQATAAELRLRVAEAAVKARSAEAEIEAANVALARMALEDARED